MKKASLIENFQIPNDKEAILGVLRFIQTKVNLLAAEKATNDSWYWMKLWYIKAQESYNRAVTALPGDQTPEQIYLDIKDKAEKMKKTVTLKKMIIPGIIAIYIVVMFIQALLRQ